MITDLSYSKLNLRVEIAVESFGSTGMVYFADQMRVMKINETCLYIIDMIRRNHPIEKIEKSFADKYSLNNDRSSSDLHDILYQLIEFDIIYITSSCDDADDRCRFQQRAGIEVSLEETECYLFERESRYQVLLNGSGFEMWNKLEIPRCVSELATDQCMKHSDLSWPRSLTDTRDFIDEMVSYDFIREVEGDFE